MADSRLHRVTDVYDWWSGRQLLFRALQSVALSGRYRRLHGLAVDRLFAGDGDRVLDLGCGPGVNFRALSDAVGGAESVVGLDVSEGMTRRARERAGTLDTATSVVRGDAATLPFPDDSFERAFSTLAVSAVPDAEAALTEVARVLRPGGRFVVLDTRAFETFPLAYINPVLNPLSEWATEWHPERDVPALLRERFDPVHVETFNGGSSYVATAELS